MTHFATNNVSQIFTMKRFNLILPAIAVLVCACDKSSPEELPVELAVPELSLELGNVAKIISELPIEDEQLMEVFDAVNSSSGNGYDEEYMFEDLLTSPGAGVGDAQTKSGRKYSRPIKDLLRARLSETVSTKSGVSAEDVEIYLNKLLNSDIQIYWPYSELWDGKTRPLVTYDPGNGASSNYAYELIYDRGSISVTDSILVDESVAQSRPVWVINTNDDSSFTPLQAVTKSQEFSERYEDTENPEVRRLTLTTFTMLQHYDSWFGGASEFFVKCGAVDNFYAETEEEMRNYTPQVTDFMISVKRSQLNKTIPLRAILLSNYTEQMESIALVITEDDGGEVTSWKCSGVVKIKSKSYGFEIEIPYRDRDDIVWRGLLHQEFFKTGPYALSRFGGVMLGFSLN